MAAREENPVSTARNKVSACAMNINTQADAIAIIANTLFGPEPPMGGAANAHPSRMGESGLLHDDLENLAECIERLGHQVDRLRSLGIDNGPSVGMGNPAPIGLRR